MLPALLPALLLALPSLQPTTEFEGSVGAGGGYDSNVDLAPSSAGSASFGTVTLSTWVDGGWSFPLSRTARLYAGARYDEVVSLDVPDLSRHVPGADVALTWRVAREVAIALSIESGYGFYGDSARNAVRVSARALVRVRPLDWLTLRAGYARAQSWASTPVYSLGVHRLLVSAEARVARRTYLALGYSLSTGGQVLYALVPGAGRTPAQRRRLSSLQPFQADATEHTLSLRAEQGLWRELYLTATFEHTRGSSVQGPYAVNSVFGGVGYRF